MPIFDRAHTDDLLTFLAASPTPYHAVANAAERLERPGSARCARPTSWERRPRRRYVVRGGAMVAWFVPEGAPPSTPFRIVGAHTDSPNLRVKPQPDTGRRAGGRSRSRCTAGRCSTAGWTATSACPDGLVLRGGETPWSPSTGRCCGYRSSRSTSTAPSTKGVALDRQRHTQPVWGLGDVDEGALIRYAAEEAGVDASEVVGWDLMTHDVQPPAYLGRDGELLAAARLDDRLSVHAGTAALIAAASRPGPGTCPGAGRLRPRGDRQRVRHRRGRAAARRGAGTVDLRARRLVRGPGARPRGHDCLSADMGHAVHPNYTERHDPATAPCPTAGRS